MCSISNITAIDLFAGLGGFTEGAAEAGVRVVWAANHWPAAVQLHRANHPHTDHICQDLQQADWRRVPDHHILLASPACQGHSPARGREQPHHDACRSTAWAVVACAEAKQPEALIVENVPAFRRWSLYPAWKHALQLLGYHITEQLIDAADCGVPQHRTRLFVVGCRQRPIVIVPPGHAHQPAAGTIDWSAGRWSPVDRPGRAARTLDRIAAGRAEFGERFLVCYYSRGSGRTGRSLHRPVGTITTRDRWAIIDGDHMRMFTPSECRAAMGFRSEYVIPRDRKLAVHMLGNAVPPPLAAHVIDQVCLACDMDRRSTRSTPCQRTEATAGTAT